MRQWIGGLTALLLATGAQALTFDFSALSDQTSGSGIGVTAGGITATASGWGGLTNPQNTIDPTDPGASGASNIGVNIGGVSLFGTRGVGCGATLASQCDLIAPVGEDAMLITFSTTVSVTGITGAAIEDADDVSVYTWNGSSWATVGTDNCGLFSFCGGEEPLGHVSPGNLPTATTQYLLLVAQNSGATAFAVARLSADEVVVPEPGSLALLGLGLLGLRRAAQRR